MYAIILNNLLAILVRNTYIRTYKLAVLYVLTCDLQHGSPREAFERSVVGY